MSWSGTQTSKGKCATGALMGRCWSSHVDTSPPQQELGFDTGGLKCAAAGSQPHSTPEPQVAGFVHTVLCS